MDDLDTSNSALANIPQQNQDSGTGISTAGMSPLTAVMASKALEYMPSEEDIQNKRQGLMNAYKNLMNAQQFVPSVTSDPGALAASTAALNASSNPGSHMAANAMLADVAARQHWAEAPLQAAQEQAKTGIAANTAATNFSIEDLKNAMGLLNSAGMTDYRNTALNMQRMRLDKDAMGNPIVVDKMTGQTQPLTPAIAKQFGIQTSNNQGGNQGGQSDSGNQTPAFGFTDNPYANNAQAQKAAMQNAATFEKGKESRDTLANQALMYIDVAEPDLKKVYGGSGINRLGLGVGNLYGSDQVVAANEAAGETKNLALTMSQMQQQPGGRAMKASLQALLDSKPDPYQKYNEVNQNLINEARSTVNNYKLETEFLSAYKDANPLHTIDGRAYDLFDALRAKYPTFDPQTKQFKSENVQQFRDAIPDALANPYNYLTTKHQGAAAPVISKDAAMAEAQRRAAAGNKNFQSLMQQQKTQPQ